MKKVTPTVITCDACEKYISYAERGTPTTRLSLNYKGRWIGQEGVTLGLNNNYPEYDFCDMDCLVKWIKREDDKEI